MVSKKYIVIYLFLALVPVVFLAMEYSALPDMVALRNNGQSPEDFGNKINLWLTPTFGLLLAIIGVFIPKIPKKKKVNMSQSVTEKIFVVLLLVYDGVFAIELSMAKGGLSNSNLGMTVLLVSLLPIVVISVIGLIKSKN